MSVHSIRLDALTRTGDVELKVRGSSTSRTARPIRSAARGAAAADPQAVALLGPHRSAAVTEAVEVSAPAGLPLLAPVATWPGITRDERIALAD